jgi:transcription antitermination protein NusB
MPSRRQIRESAVQFLYCADLEGGADPTVLREPFWEFVTEAGRRTLVVSTARAVLHLAHGREGRLAEFFSRAQSADALLGAHPEAETLRSNLRRIHERESAWSSALTAIQRLPRDDADDTVAGRFSKALAAFFQVDRDLAASRARFFQDLEDFPSLRGPLEPVTATLRRLQRISDRLRMVEEPERFPEQADLARLRESKTEIAELRSRTDALVDAILAGKPAIDRKLAESVENYAPERIDPVDRAILRLAVHEILSTDTPAKVAIHEAVDLAKRFGTSDSGRFVNGVLDHVAGLGGGKAAAGETAPQADSQEPGILELEPPAGSA